MEFKNGQKVKHPKYGKGKIYFTLHSEYCVIFNEVQTNVRGIGDDFYNKLEPVEDLPEIGEYAYFWNNADKKATYGKFEGWSDAFEKHPYCINGYCYFNVSKTPPFK